MHIEVISRRPASGFSDKVPLLCVPGGFQGAWCWDEYFLPFFAEAGFEAHALSLRGHGASDGHENINQWRLDDYVEDLATVISKMPVHPVLIGHSVGGAVIQKYLEKHVAPAAILLASSPTTRVMSTTFRMAMKHPASYISMLFTRDMQHALKMLDNNRELVARHIVSWLTNKFPKCKQAEKCYKENNSAIQCHDDLRTQFNQP